MARSDQSLSIINTILKVNTKISWVSINFPCVTTKFELRSNGSWRCVFIDHPMNVSRMSELLCCWGIKSSSFQSVCTFLASHDIFFTKIQSSGSVILGSEPCVPGSEAYERRKFSGPRCELPENFRLSKIYSRQLMV